MNILLVAHERNLGGASKSLVTLATELKNNGNKVIVIVPFRKGQLFQALTENKIKTYVVFFGWWMMPSYWNPLLRIAFKVLYKFEWIAIYKISAIVKRENIDVIHTNSSVIDIGMRVANKIGIPHIWHFREFGDADFQLEFIKGWNSSCKDIRESNSKIIFISNNLRNYYKEEIPDSMCDVVYNGISQNFLNSKDYKINRKKVIFLISGNLHRNKGQHIALEAVNILKKWGYCNLELWIAGQTSAMSDSKKYTKELYKLAAKNIQGNYKFLGYVSDMKKLREKADVELVCSNREAFGRVTVEAMMAGNPVIGTDAGANPELIIDKVNGRLFKNKSPEDLAAKMKWFLNRPQYINECGSNAYSYAKEKFLSSVNTNKIMNIYKGLVD